MANDNLLARLKIDLGIINSTVYDERLNVLLNVAEREIIREGAKTLSRANIDDAELIIDYARWQWLCRREPQAMPRDLRYRLNNRVFSEKAGQSNV